MSTEATAIFNCMWDLLNVRISAGKPSGWRTNLTKIRVQTFRHRVDQLDHVLPVTGERLLNRAVLQQRCYHWVLRRQRLHFPVTRGIGNRDSEPIERLR